MPAEQNLPVIEVELDDAERAFLARRAAEFKATKPQDAPLQGEDFFRALRAEATSLANQTRKGRSAAQA